MRLTLRTLLAYLDRILDDEDAHELSQKVKDSELANQLIRRIDHVLTQRPTAALAVHDTKHTNDANTVAQYLDNTLKPEQMADFERACLESDTRLAEVAACHQILTLVLGERAEVAERLRQRIHRLDREQPHPSGGSAVPVAHVSPSVDDGQAEPTASTPANAVSQAASRAGEDRPANRPFPVGKAKAVSAATETADSGESWVDEDEHWRVAPDYLKRPRRSRLKPVLLAALIAFCLAMAGLRGMGRFDHTHPLAQRFGLANVPADVSQAEAGGSTSGTAVPAGPNPLAADAASADQLAQENGDGMPGAGEVTSGRPESIAVDRTPDQPFAGDPGAERARAEANLVNADANVDEEMASEQDGPGPLPEPDQVVAVDDAADIVSAPTPAALDETPAEMREPLGPPIGEATSPPAARSSVDEAMEDTPPADPIATLDQDPNNAPGSDLAVEMGDTADSPTTSNSSLRPPAGEPMIIDPLADDGTAAPFDPATADPDDPRFGPAGPLIRESDLANLPPAAGELPDEATADRPASAADPTPRVMEIGRFLDPQQVLLRADADTDDWERVAKGTLLREGDTLMSLPTFRPPLALGSGMQVSLIGATRVSVMPIDAERPHLQIDFGRLTIATLAKAGTSLGLHWGDQQQAVVTLDDTNTTLAISLRHLRLPGTDPLTTPAHAAIEVFVTSGSAEWASGDQEPLTLKPGSELIIVDRLPAQLRNVEQLPLWIDNRDERPRDPLARDELSKHFDVGRPARMALKEILVDERLSRLLELKSLTIASLAYLGDVPHLFTALNDPKLRSYWDGPYEALQDVLALSPDMAAKVKEAVEIKHQGPAGDVLFRLLWGYSPTQLNDGGAATLIEHLEHPSLDFRIVAVETLKQITGLPSLYRPYATERDPQRRSAIARWRRHLDDGEIVYREKPQIVEWLEQAMESQGP